MMLRLGVLVLALALPASSGRLGDGGGSSSSSSGSGGGSKQPAAPLPASVELATRSTCIYAVVRCTSSPRSESAYSLVAIYQVLCTTHHTPHTTHLPSCGSSFHGSL